MSFGLSTNAEYTAKIFIVGLSVKSNITNSPAIIEDGDETIQEGGQSGELTFTVSRTSG